MTKTLYTITDWNQDYENAESRKLEQMNWVRLPISTDGLLFKRIAQHKKRSELLAAMFLMIQVAARSRKGKRGALIFNGRPLDAVDMALMTGWPVSTFQVAFGFFSDPDVGWLTISPEVSAAVPPPSATPPPLSATLPPLAPDVPPPSATPPPESPDRERERGEREEERERGEETPPANPQASTNGRPNALHEVIAYAAEYGASCGRLIPAEEPEKFFDHFSANGWRTRSGPLRDWRAAFRNWVRNGRRFGDGGEAGVGGPKNRGLAPGDDEAGKYVKPEIFK